LKNWYNKNKKCANNGLGYSDGAGHYFCKCKPYTAGKQCQIGIIDISN